MLCRLLDTRVTFGSAFSRPRFEILSSGHGPPFSVGGPCPSILGGKPIFEEQERAWATCTAPRLMR